MEANITKLIFNTTELCINSNENNIEQYTTSIIMTMREKLNREIKILFIQIKNTPPFFEENNQRYTVIFFKGETSFLYLKINNKYTK